MVEGRQMLRKLINLYIVFCNNKNPFSLIFFVDILMFTLVSVNMFTFVSVNMFTFVSVNIL